MDTKIAIVGSGFGMYCLLPAFNKIKGCKVVGICGKDSERMTNYCKKFGVNRYTNWQEMLEKEKPDALLPNVGVQNALDLAVSLSQNGILEKYGVELIGSNIKAIYKAENRELFKKEMDKGGIETARGGFAKTSKEADTIIEDIPFPVIIRPSFTMGGTGGSVAYNGEEFHQLVEAGLSASPISEVLIEESLLGWKEYELEVMRDLNDNLVIICSIENFDPMGIHTGDSITVAPVSYTHLTLPTILLV